MIAVYMKLLKAEREVNQQEGEDFFQLVHDLRKDDGYVALKRAANTRE